MESSASRRVLRHLFASVSLWLLSSLSLSAFGVALLLGGPARAQHAHTQGPGETPGGAQRPGEEGDRQLAVPPVDLTLEELDIREHVQRQTLERFKVPVDFRFENRREASGIRFQHHIVEDAGKRYKSVHYDHGNGVAVADVDGDGRLDLYFTTQLGRNELWRNLGGGRFEDVTEAAGVGLADRVSVTASFADADNDGDPDLFVTTVRMGNVLFENVGQGRFRDVTAASGLVYVGHSSGATFFDYDNDGLLDLLVTNVGRYTSNEKGPGGYWVGLEGAFGGHLDPARAEPSRLYKNLGGLVFREVSEEVGLVDLGWSGDAAFADLNGDRYPDLYVPNMQGDDHFYENQAGRRFVERTAELFPKTPWGTMGINFFDYDNDGLQDLILTDMHSDMSRVVTPGYEKLKSRMLWPDEVLQGGANNLFGNALFHNLGGGKFEEVSDAMGTECFWPWGVSVGDLNADGYDDVLITASMNFPYRYGLNSVLLNNRAEVFLDSELLLGVEPRQGALKKPWFRLECSGADREHQLCVGVSGPVTVMGSTGSRSSVLFDLEGDGDLDVVTNEMNDAPQVLVSNLAQTRTVHALSVRLIGTASNRDGLGARVRVHAGGRDIVRVHDGKSGYLSQSSMPLYVGLGEAEKVDWVEIAWPSGKLQRVTEVPLGRPLEVVEP